MGLTINGRGRCSGCSHHVATQGHAPDCLRPSRLMTRAEARAQATAQRRAAIDACPRCDENGFVDVDASGTAVRHCEHRREHPARDWLTDVEDRRDAIAERLAELDGGDR